MKRLILSVRVMAPPVAFQLSVVFLTSCVALEAEICPPPPALRVAKTIAVDGFPRAIAISPDGRFAYVSLLDQNSVAVIDTRRREIAERITVGKFPLALVSSPDGNQLFVSNSLSRTIVIVDTATRKVVRTVEEVPGVVSLAMGAGGRLLYGASPRRDFRGLFVIDTRSTNPQEQVRRITDGRGQGEASLPHQVAASELTAQVNSLSSPTGVVAAPSGKHLYALNPVTREVTVILAGTRKVVATIPLPDAPWEMAITPDSKQLLVTHPESGTVSLIDAEKNSVSVTIPAGQAPYGVAVSHDGCWAAVINAGSADVSLLELPYRRTRASVKLPDSMPVEVALGPDGRAAYVTDPKTRSVLVLAAAP